MADIAVLSRCGGGMAESFTDCSWTIKRTAVAAITAQARNMAVIKVERIDKEIR